MQTETQKMEHEMIKMMLKQAYTKKCKEAVSKLGKLDSYSNTQFGDVPEYKMEDYLEKAAVEAFSRNSQNSFLLIQNVSQIDCSYSVVWYKDELHRNYQIIFFDQNDLKLWHISKVDMYELREKHFSRSYRQKKIKDECARMVQDYIDGKVIFGVSRTLNQFEEFCAFDSIQEVKEGEYVIVQERHYSHPICMVWYKHTNEQVFQITFSDTDLTPKVTALCEVDLDDIAERKKFV